MNENQITEAAECIYTAQQKGTSIQALSEQFPDFGIETAYQIQARVTQMRVSNGARIIGRKIGVTNQAVMDLFKTDRPVCATLFAEQAISNNGVIKRAGMLQPRVEAEIAFFLKKDLQGPDITPLQVMGATEGVLAALEIVDSRLKGINARIEDIIADNVSFAGIVLGSSLHALQGIDLRFIGLATYKNDQLVSTAAGAAVLGNPLAAMAWLANKLAESGEKLLAGDIILSGSLIAAFAIDAGDRVEAVFDRLGPVVVNVV